jgi:ferritin-like metal-binding protein YciE
LREIRAAFREVVCVDGAHNSCFASAVDEIHFAKELPMASTDTLNELLQDELKDIYDAEKQLTKALPKLAKKATAEELKDAFEEHLRQTEEHIERLDQAFEHLGIPARGKKCKGMKNLIAEGEDMIGDADEDAVRDAVMIAAAQKVEHYEIASYGTARTWAAMLGHDDVASLLEQTLEEEKETDQKLTELAEAFINQAAAEEGGEEDEAAQPARRAVRGSSSRVTRLTAADRKRSR